MDVIGVPHAGTVCVTGLMVSELHGLERAAVGTVVVGALVVPAVAVPVVAVPTVVVPTVVVPAVVVPAVEVVGPPVVVDPANVGASGLGDGFGCPHAAATTAMAVNVRIQVVARHIFELLPILLCSASDCLRQLVVPGPRFSTTPLLSGVIGRRHLLLPERSR